MTQNGYKDNRKFLYKIEITSNDLRTTSSGYSGPNMNLRSREVRAWLTRCHCVIRASWCLQ